MNDSRITPSVLYRMVGLAFLLVVGGLIFQQLATVLVGALIVAIFATALSGWADLLERIRIHRSVGAVIGLLLFLAALGGLLTLLIPVFSSEIHQFVNAAPGIVSSLLHRVARLTGSSPHRIGNQVQSFLNTYTQHPSKLLGPLSSVGTSAVTIVTTIIILVLSTLYAAIFPDPLISGIVRLWPPQRRGTARVIIRRLHDAYLGWLGGLLIGMLVLGGLTYGGLMVIGLRYAVFFAFFTAIAMIVPYYGSLISSIVPILYALTISVSKAVVVAILYVVAHQVDSNVIEPLIVARTVKLHPAVVALGVVAVGALFGFVGLIISVPIMGTIKILVEELWINPMERRDAHLIVAEPAGRHSDVVSITAPSPPPVEQDTAD